MVSGSQGFICGPWVVSGGLLVVSVGSLIVSLPMPGGGAGKESCTHEYTNRLSKRAKKPMVLRDVVCFVIGYPKVKVLAIM